MTDRDEWTDRLAIIIAQARWGSSTPDMGGRDNPRPVEKGIAARFMEDLERDGWRRVVAADITTVARVATAIHDAVNESEPQGDYEAAARAAINAVGAGVADTAEAQHRGTCRSCHAPILWVTTTKGADMPVDADPSSDGNVQLVSHGPALSRDWVQDLQRVEARYGGGDGIHATGSVIGYTEEPTVVIVTDDGEHVWWLARLCRPVTETGGRDG